MVDYLDPIKINSDKSGFCILQFDVSLQGEIRNPSVVWSTGHSYEELAFTVLNSIKRKGLSFFQRVHTSKIRLPIYFQRKTNWS